MAELSVAQAASALGVNPSRMRALAASGAVAARRVGGRWVVDAAAVQARAHAPTSASRPMAPATAWAAAWLLDGQSAPWLSPADRSRLRARLRAHTDLTIAVWLGWVRNRAGVVQLRADAAAQHDLLQDSRVRLGGVSAAPHAGLDLVAPGQTEVYVGSGDLDALTQEFMLLPSSRGNVTVHVVPGQWHLGDRDPSAGQRSVPRGVVIADLFEAGDARSRNAAQSLLEAVNRDSRRAV